MASNIVFFGDSITQFWKDADPDFFANKHIINHGISGQTTAEMLLRFKDNVINKNTQLVIILAGINDIAENSGPITTDQIFENIKKMCEMALKNDINVILSSVLPAKNCYWRPHIETISKINALNSKIKEYSVNKNLNYIDYYSIMVDENDGLPKNLAHDGVHPTKEGYKIMKELILPVIEKYFPPI